MILSFMILNNFGKGRLLKFYRHMVSAAATLSREPTAWHARSTCTWRLSPSAPLSRRVSCPTQPEQQQQQVVSEIFAALNARSDSASSFIDAPELFASPGARVVYRMYATLFFCAVIDGSESELGMLDLIQVLVETLDHNFKNVCELDLIFNMEQARARACRVQLLPPPPPPPPPPPSARTR